MKHFLVLNGFWFYMTDGVVQKDNVSTVINKLDQKNVRYVLRDADKSKDAVRNNPVLSKLLSKILLCGTRKITSP